MNRRAKCVQPRKRALFLERLETRQVLDGNVNVFLSGGSLDIRGDAGDNQITIEQHSPHSFVVSSRDGTTTINGQTDPQTFFGVTKDVDILMGQGNNIVDLDGADGGPISISRQLNIGAGSGDDQVLMTRVHAERIYINTRGGDDTLNIGNGGDNAGITVSKKATVFAGSGQDDVAIFRSSFNQALDLSMGAGDDTTTMKNVSVGRKSTIDGGGGSDTLEHLNYRGKLNFVSYQNISDTITAPAPTTTNSAPTAADDTATVARGGNTTINVVANDTAASGHTLDLTSIAITQQPTGGTVTANSDGTVKYTSNSSGTATSDSFQYTIADQDGNVSEPATVSITITSPSTTTAVNDTATVASGSSTTINVATNDTAATGQTLDLTSIAITQQPTSGTVTANNNGTVTYTSNSGTTATSDTFQYTIKDSAGTVSNAATVSITVTAPAPIALGDTATVASGSSTTINVAANDTATTGRTLDLTSIAITQQPASGTVTANSDGTVTYTSNSGTTATSDTFQYTIKDSAGTVSNATTVSITITAPAPNAADDTATVPSGSSTTINVAANDTAASGQTLDLTSITITQQPASGTLTVNNDGTAVYSSTSGTTATSDSFQYTIKDSTGTVSNAATVSITITSPAVTALDDTATVVSGGSTTIDIAANDSAGSGHMLDLNSITITQQPTSGTLTLNADGSVIYSNDSGSTATNDSFQYTIKDDAGTVSNPATVSITIVAPLSAAGDSATIDEDSASNPINGNVLSNDMGGAGAKSVSAVNGSTANVGVDVPGLHGTFHINANGDFTYTLNNADAAVNLLVTGETLTDSLEYTAAAGSETATATLAITIDGHTDTAFNAVDDAFNIAEDATPDTVSDNVLNNDTNAAGAVTVTAVNGVAANVGIIVNGQFGTFQVNSDGGFTYTLDNSNATVDALNDGDTLTDTITYEAGDGVTTSSATLKITILGHTD
jgi:VCBS repeat-containing protein